MQTNKYIYIFNYDKTRYELCKLESCAIFEEEEKNKLLFSNIQIEPSSSAFIKKRLDIISFSDDYTSLIKQIKKEGICCEGFKVEYVVVHEDVTAHAHRLEKLKDIGYSIDGNTGYYPIKTYALCYYAGVWSFDLKPCLHSKIRQ